MSLRHFVTHTATAVAVAACLLAVSAVRAADFGDDGQLMAFTPPVSAPCHISLHACAKPERLATKGSAAVYPTDRWFEPASAPCHPALKACRS
jgi:hypothetical protein